MAESRISRFTSVAVLPALLVVVVWALVFVADAGAYTGINSFTAVQSDTQAGGHPDLHLRVTFDNRETKDGVQTPPDGEGCGCQDVRDLKFNLPAGFIGTPLTTPRCTLAQFSSVECPPESQVGITTATTRVSAVYNMEPHAGQAALLAFYIPNFNSPGFIDLHARTGSSDYGLVATFEGVYHPAPIVEVSTYLWGVPAAASHDALRFPLHGGTGCQRNGSEPEPCFPPVHSNAAPTPFLQNPTTCGAELSSEVELTYYDGTVVSASAPWVRTTGCEQLSFNPSLTAQPTTTQSDTASGLDVNLLVPAILSPTVPASSEIKATTTELPPGISINPNASDGKTVCSEAQSAYGTEGEAQCPENSKVGIAEFESASLPGIISGGVYLAEPRPANPYRIVLIANGYATHVKLLGSVRANPVTGQLVTTFEDLPQAPFYRFGIHYFGSERGLLATPTHCGTFPVRSTFVPWDEDLPNQESFSRLTIDSGPGGSPCPTGSRPFSPQLSAGTADNTAGKHSPFSLRLTLADGEQFLSALTVRTPPGFTATLAGVPYCPESHVATFDSSGYSGLTELATPACPLQSQIGTAITGTGAGTHPLYTTGRVFLAGPYKGAPLSILVVVPAVSGPYDLGTVAVRSAVHVNPETAEISVSSDPFPQILAGVPLRTRSLQIDLDRPNFTLNPTSCEPAPIVASALGDEAALAQPANNYQAANCGNLEFAPKLSLRLSGGVKRRGHPVIDAHYKAAEGEANARQITVTLPSGEQLDNSHILAVCTRPQFAQNACPPASQIGSATVKTPLLEAPLEGKVYLRTNPTRSLPDLVLDLEGQIHIELVGRVSSTKSGALRTTLTALPDAPVSSVDLHLLGGARGLLQNSESLCGAHKAARVRLLAQSGAVAAGPSLLHVDCPSSRHKRIRRDHR